MNGTLYVLPNILSSDNFETLSVEALTYLENLRHFAVENKKTARRSIRGFGISTDFNECVFYNIHHKTDDLELAQNYSNAIQALKAGTDVGILSDAGMAGIADPGSRLIALAHENGIRVKPIVGPSSILLALCASGFNGQKFTFHGYLPIEARHRAADLKAIEAEVIRSNTSQIFMETPYRNGQLLKAITENLRPETLLCVAANITANDEFIETRQIQHWKKLKFDINKKPAIFIVGSF